MLPTEIIQLNRVISPLGTGESMGVAYLENQLVIDIVVARFFIFLFFSQGLF